MAAAAKAESTSALVVDEETAREIFSKYSQGGSTIEKSDVRELAFTLGDTLSDEEVEKVFTELDADGNGHIEFGEFYSWLSNPDRERSGNVTRMIRAQLMASAATRLLKSVMANGAGRKVALEEGKTAIDLHFAAGEVGDEDAAFKVTAKAGPVPEEAPIPADAKMAASFTFAFQDEAAAGAMGGYAEEVCASMNELFEKEDDEDAPRLSSAAGEVEGAPCVTVTVAFPTGEMAQMSDAMGTMLTEGASEILEGGGAFDFPEFLTGVEAKIALGMSPSDVVGSDGASFLSDFAADFQLKGSLERSGLMLMNAMLKNAAEASFMMEDEYKMAAKACKVAGSLAEVTQAIRFHSFKDLVGSVSKGAAEMLGQVPMKMVALGPVADIVDDLATTDEVPPAVMQAYNCLREEGGTLRRVQFWGAGAYGQADIEGFGLDFLPSKEEAHAIKEES